MNFTYTNIQFEKHPQENWLMVKGEITNNTGRNYNAVVFRVILFIKSVPVGNITVTIRGFYAGQTKTFEAQVGDLDYKIIPEITRTEMYAESAY